MAFVLLPGRRRWRSLLRPTAAGLLLLAVAPATAATAAPNSTAVATPSAPSPSAPHARTDHELVDLAARPAVDRRTDAMAAEVREEPELRSALRAADRTAAERTVEPFTAIGVTVPAEPSGPVFVRGLAGGAWSPWFEAHFAPEEAPDAGAEPGRPGLHSHPIWLGTATAYEIDGPPDLERVEAHLVREGPVSGLHAASTGEPSLTSAQLGPPRAGGVAQPAISTRQAWGARAAAVPPSIMNDLKVAVVHHSVSSNAYSAAQVPGLLRSIQAYHMDAQGWNDIAYNFAVDRFGRIWEGRGGGVDRLVLGGHSQGFNTGTVGIVVLGDFTSSTVPTAVEEAIARVTAWKFAVHHVMPTSTVLYTTAGSTKYAAGATITLPRIVGHRDVQSTSCPGARLYARLPTIRTRVAQLVPTYQRSLPAVVVAPDVDGNGLIDPIEYRTGAPADAEWRATGTGGFSRTARTITMAYEPAVGDFNGDGRDDVLWHGGGSTPDHIWWSQASGTRSQSVNHGGSYAPVVGDFDGNGSDDILWYNPGPGPDHLWYFSANGTFAPSTKRQDLITTVPLVGDFDGDGIDDILWHGPGSASDQLWLGRSNQTFGVRSLSVNLAYAPIVLDADGNGIDDVLWFRPGATSSPLWIHDADAQATTRTIAHRASSGAPVAAGDFDGDGFDDAFVYAPGGGADALLFGAATGMVERPIAVSLTYAVVAGPTRSAAPDADDLLFISTAGADHRWTIRADRTVASARVG